MHEHDADTYYGSDCQCVIRFCFTHDRYEITSPCGECSHGFGEAFEGIVRDDPLEGTEGYRDEYEQDTFWRGGKKEDDDFWRG